MGHVKWQASQEFKKGPKELKPIGERKKTNAFRPPFSELVKQPDAGKGGSRGIDFCKLEKHISDFLQSPEDAPLSGPYCQRHAACVCAFCLLSLARENKSEEHADRGRQVV